MTAATPVPVQLTGVLYRIANYDTPFWGRANTEPGRYHRPEPGRSVQYWSTTPHTAWAEHLRSELIASAEDLQGMRSRLWAAYWRLDRLADLTTTPWREWCGVTGRALTAQSHKQCQAAGARVQAEGLSGLIAPSAALAGGINVVVFGPRAAGDWVPQPDGEAQRLRSDTFVPAQLAAIGSPDPELVAQVRPR